MKSLFDFKTLNHQELKGHSTIIREDVIRFLDRILDVVYPGNIRRVFKYENDLIHFQNENNLILENILKTLGIKEEDIKPLSQSFTESLIKMNQLICTDALVLLEGDPSATSLNEVILTYPGLEAIASYRVAHFFYEAHVPILPRALSEVIHGRTGIDIHPGAKIGESFFIDHGTGVVIGETAIIGKNVKIYQGVTLGALSVDKTLAKKKRHPTIEDNVVIYSNATILGGETVIGENSIIGGNVWITKSIPSQSTVYHKSEVKLQLAPNSSEEITYEI